MCIYSCMCVWVCVCYYPIRVHRITFVCLFVYCTMRRPYMDSCECTTRARCLWMWSWMVVVMAFCIAYRIFILFQLQWRLTGLISFPFVWRCYVNVLVSVYARTEPLEKFVWFMHIMYRDRLFHIENLNRDITSLMACTVCCARHSCAQ